MKNKQFGVLNNGGGHSQKHLCRLHKRVIAVLSSMAMLFTTSAVLPYSNFNFVGEITASAEETEPQETYVASVTINGVNNLYTSPESFVNAIEEAKGEANVKLLQDVDLGESELYIPEGLKLTLDCGEYTLTSSGFNTVYVEGDFFFTGGTLLNAAGRAGTSVSVSGSFTMSGGVVDGKNSNGVVQSRDINSHIIITGGTVGVDGDGLSVSMGTVKLSGGTYSSISISKKTGETLTNILPEGYALQGTDGLMPRDTVITTESKYGTAVGKKFSNVAVVECPHTGADATANNDGTHSLNCQYCGCTKEEECTYGNEYQHDNKDHWQTCEVCGGENTEEHKLTHIEEKESTCTEDGNTEYWKCNDCGTCFSDENGETEINQSETVISATGHKYSDGKCTVCGAFEDGIGVHLAGHSISLDGNIGVNFYMELDKSVIEDSKAFMNFTLPNGRIQAVNVSQAKTADVDGKIYYVFPCKVAAKEMFDTIKAQIITSDGRKGEVYKYSVKEYADYIFSNTDNYDYETVELVRAMLYYGETASLYFSSLIIGSNSDLDKVTADTLKKFEKQTAGNLPDGITYYGSSLLLESETKLRHYFKVAQGVSLIEYGFSFSGNKEGGYYYTDISDIPAGQLATPQDTKIGEWSISYSPMSYAYDVLNSKTASDNLKNLVKALYLYEQAAEAYKKT